MLSLKCFENFTFRHVVNFALVVAFMISVIANINKYAYPKTVVTESARRAMEVIYPSITMCPFYKNEYAHSKTSGTKNLTEYYENLLNMAQIKKDILSISQPYITKNGRVGRAYIND